MLFGERIVIESHKLDLREKALLLAMLTVHSFDREGVRAFHGSHWHDTANALGISSKRAARIWMRLREMRVIFPGSDPNDSYMQFDLTPLITGRAEGDAL